jgi:hypothetical protein
MQKKFSQLRSGKDWRNSKKSKHFKALPTSIEGLYGIIAR